MASIYVLHPNKSIYIYFKTCAFILAQVYDSLISSDMHFLFNDNRLKEEH